MNTLQSESLKDIEIFHFARSLSEIRLCITDVIIWWQLRVVSQYQLSDNLTVMKAVSSNLRQSQKLRRFELYNWATRLKLPFRILKTGHFSNCDYKSFSTETKTFCKHVQPSWFIRRIVFENNIRLRVLMIDKSKYNSSE